MPRLRTYEIANAMYGSTQLSAVYMGNTQIWKEQVDADPIAYDMINLAVSEGNIFGEDGDSARRAFWWVPGVPEGPSNGPKWPGNFQYTTDTGSAGTLDCWPNNFTPDQIRYRGWTYTRMSIKAARGNPYNTFLIKIAARAPDWPEYPNYSDDQIILEDGTPDPLNPIVESDKLPSSIPSVT